MRFRAVTALIIILAFAPTAAWAQRTTYYARTRLLGIPSGTGGPTYTYQPTYSTTWSACSGGTQSQPIASCTRSDGQPTATSQCSPQSNVRSCNGVSCAALVQYRQPSGGTFTSLGTAATDTAATAACQNYVTQNNAGAGVCQYTSGDSKVGYRTGGTWTSSSDAIGGFASTCQ